MNHNFPITGKKQKDLMVEKVDTVFLLQRIDIDTLFLSL